MLSIKALTKFALLFLLAGAMFGQTVTPNTTLCAAVTISATQVCLTSTTNVTNQTGLFMDGEYMQVYLTAAQSVLTGPAYVPVARNRFFAGSGPTAHNSGAVVWEAYVPTQTPFPGDNGFEMGSPQVFTFTGPCVRANYQYLPRIIPDRGVMRDCPVVNGATTGVWTDWNPNANTIPVQNTFQAITASGAILPTAGNYVVTKAGVAAMTLAAPTATVQDFTLIKISSATAYAHTVTATGLLQTGSASVNTATCAAYAGCGLTLMAYQGKWIVVFSVGVTFS